MHCLFCIIVLLTYLTVNLFASSDHDATAHCQGISCQNGGTCKQASNGTYVCDCKLGYKGVLCDQIWLTEDKFVAMEDTLRGLSAMVSDVQFAQLTQYGDFTNLRRQLGTLNDCKAAVNWPRFFVPWTSLNLSSRSTDISFVHVGSKLILASLDLSSLMHIFELSNENNISEFQSLTIPHARSVVGFHIGGKRCFAVARSRRISDHEVRSVLYCWSTPLNTFTLHQEFPVRGATHVDHVTIGQKSLLFFTASTNSSSVVEIYLWSEPKQWFFLYQSFPSNGAHSAKVVNTQHSTYLVIQEENKQIYTSKMYSWNGNYFNQPQLHQFESGFVFAVGNDIFKITNRCIHRLDLNSESFVFHSFLGGSRDTNNTYNFFPIRNEFYLAESQYERNGTASLLLYRMNGFDFMPYQNISLKTYSYNVKALPLRRNRVLLAVTQENTVELLTWNLS